MFSRTATVECPEGGALVTSFEHRLRSAKLQRAPHFTGNFSCCCFVGIEMKPRNRALQRDRRSNATMASWAPPQRREEIGRSVLELVSSPPLGFEKLPQETLEEEETNPRRRTTQKEREREREPFRGRSSSDGDATAKRNDRPIAARDL
ncbi:hypothetical protein NL676_001462 [Syzygium grande]|nr:hypothetical protein NL676_001462 [Syzygium grande]